MKTSWDSLNEAILNCRKCKRLIKYCQNLALAKKKQYQNEIYWGKPVIGFGDPSARLWIVGLAPGAHGANRTGRVFTGDSSGDWLFSALCKVGLCNQPNSTGINDGLYLINTFISCVGRCAPPDNKPNHTELIRCHPYLEKEFDLLFNKRVILALGKIAFDSVIKLLRLKKFPINRSFQFKHNAIYRFQDLTLMSSYHPSRQNTQTNRLTQTMWDTIFDKAVRLL